MMSEIETQSSTETQHQKGRSSPNANDRANGAVVAGGPKRPRKALALVGFMGSGKSATAVALANACGEHAIDVDRDLVAETGKTISALFDERGEGWFRELEERKTLEALETGGVVSLGGGAVGSEKVRAALTNHVCIWLQTDLETAWQRVNGSDRPLAQSLEQFQKLHEERLPEYRVVAQVVVPPHRVDLAPRAFHWFRAMGELPKARLIWARSAFKDSSPFESKESGGSSQYPCVIGEGPLGLLSLTRLFEHGKRRCFVVADRQVLPKHGRLLYDRKDVIETNAGELSKTLNGVKSIVNQLIKREASRKDYVVAFGGGVVGDVAGFCAAEFERGGMPVVQAPTTLMSQVDSAYGGKTGVDLETGKHKFGEYHMPQSVLADNRVLSTLPRREMAAGFVEVIKTALLAGGELWDKVRKIETLRPDELDDVIFDCALVKIKIVGEDERDGKRAMLNLGHTVGHAIETAAKYRGYLHGEAVGLGILAALDIAGAEELRSEVGDLLARHDLPTNMSKEVPIDDLLVAVSRDKKSSRRGPRFVLLEHPGITGQSEENFLQSVDTDQIRGAVERLID